MTQTDTSTAPADAIAWKHADPTEPARWVTDEAEAERIAAEDPSLIVWLDTPDAITAMPAEERLPAITVMRADLLAQRDAAIRELRADGVPVTLIAELAGLSRQAIYSIAPDAEYRSQLYVWAGGEEDGHWELVMADTFRTSATPDQAMAVDQLDGWLINGDWVAGDYRCVITDDAGASLAEAEAEHNPPT